MTKDEALKLALEALNRNDYLGWQTNIHVREAIREALAQPEQEPVAWICEGSSPDEKHAIDYWPWDLDDLPIGTQLYTSPPPQRTWVGLTEQEREKLRWQALEEDAGYTQLIKATEAKLMEKNS